MTKKTRITVVMAAIAVLTLSGQVILTRRATPPTRWWTSPGSQEAYLEGWRDGVSSLDAVLDMWVKTYGLPAKGADAMSLTTQIAEWSRENMTNDELRFKMEYPMREGDWRLVVMADITGEMLKHVKE